MTQRLHHLPTALVASAVLLVVAVAVAWPIGDGTAALGAVAGVALVVLSYLVSSLVVAWVDAVARNLLLPVVLLTYALKFAVFGLAMYRVSETGWAGLRVMGVTVIVATIVWTGAQLYWILRAKIPYVQP
ncbi:hypothetical protein ABT297_31030 [Dactylosporangium sp. NPDC000555]|uniref:hypothetical protein n=1 Tax=Dactylosporangium sp. NPDC000555 TaxID=3154260 RepID=UPI0033194E1A